MFKSQRNFFSLWDGERKKLSGLFENRIFLFNSENSSSGPANDWTELIIHCLRWSNKARFYLAEEVLFKHANRFQEYLIDCTSAEVNHSSSSFFLFYL